MNRLIVAAIAACTCLLATNARADVSVNTGPTAGFMIVTSTAEHPVAIAPNAGYQLELSDDRLSMAIFGRAYDMLALRGMAFGTMLPGVQSSEFGALALGVSACTLNGLVCAGVLKDVVDTHGGLLSGKAGWCGMFSISINFALAPSAPPVGVANGAKGLVRGSTVYFGNE